LDKEIPARMTVSADQAESVDMKEEADYSVTAGYHVLTHGNQSVGLTACRMITTATSTRPPVTPTLTFPLSMAASAAGTERQS